MCNAQHSYMCPYSIQTLQSLSALNTNAHETMANAILQQLLADEIDVGNICFFDEVYFALERLDFRILGM